MSSLKGLEKATLAVGLLGAVLLFVPSWAMAGLTGRILIAGYGPELPVVQDLGKAFEKANPGVSIDIEWDRNVKAVEMVKSSEAQIAVTDHSVPDLKAVPIAWDGIAVVVNFSNPVKEATREQIRDLFTGKITRWSDLDGADTMVELIRRPPNRNMNVGFEESVGITGKVPASALVAWSDQKALSTVSGRVNAVTYVSLGEALKAMEDGIPIRVLLIDKVEPGEPTVKDGRYPLRRPVMLVTGRQPDRLTEAFVTFGLSAEGQKIIKKMFVPQSPPSLEPQRAHASTAS